MADQQTDETQRLLYENEVIAYRNEQIKKISDEVVDVNGLFRDMENIVVYQGDLLNNVEYNVENAGTNVEKGLEQIIIAKHNQRCTRKCYCWLALILCVLCGIAVVVVTVLLGR